MNFIQYFFHFISNLFYTKKTQYDSHEMTLNEKGCLSYITTSKYTLDFFFKAIPTISYDNLILLLENSWKEDKNTTIKLIFQLGNCRKKQGGKADKINFHTCLVWLYHKNPQIILDNLEQIKEHGYYKSLLELLKYVIHTEGILSVKVEREIIEEKKNYKNMIRNELKNEKRMNRLKSQRNLKEQFAKSIDKSLDEIWIQGRDEWKKTKNFTTDLTKITHNMKKDGNIYPITVNIKNSKQSNHGVWVSDEYYQQFLLFIKKRDENLKIINREKRKLNQEIINIRIQEAMKDPMIYELNEKIAIIFAKGIEEDMNTIGKSISGLASKWTPSCNSHFDKNTCIVDTIIKHLKSIHNRDDYRKAIKLLRNVAEIPESLSVNGNWDKVNYRKMPGKCRLLYGKKVYRKYDEKRYDEYLDECKKAIKNGDKNGPKVNIGAIYPHEIIRLLYENENKDEEYDYDDCQDDSEKEFNEEDYTYTYTYTENKKNDKYIEINNNMTFYEEDEEKNEKDIQEKNEEDIKEKDDDSTANLLWYELIKRLYDSNSKNKYKLIPIVDVSGSMLGGDPSPMEIGVAMGLLIAEIAQFGSYMRGKMITFHENPTLVKIDDIDDYALSTSGLREKVEKIKELDWGGTTDFDKVFELLIEAYENKEITDLENYVFIVCSDMQFDESCNGEWETKYQTIKNRFIEKGFQQIPKIVFWNLRSDTNNFPVNASQEGVVLLSGFSTGLLETLMNGDMDDFTPERQMLRVLDSKYYKNIISY
jgi:hypothetical protein